VDSIATIREALDAGVNWIRHGGPLRLGHSEEIVARALQDVPVRTVRLTKCSMVWTSAERSAQSQGPSHPAGMRGQPATAEGRRIDLFRSTGPTR